jgi:hypothetical protein
MENIDQHTVWKYDHPIQDYDPFAFPPTLPSYDENNNNLYRYISNLYTSSSSMFFIENISIFSLKFLFFFFPEKMQVMVIIQKIGHIMDFPY